MTELEKLRYLLKHWIEHNDAHIKTYSEWASKTDSLGKKELSGILDRISEESKKINRLFVKAIEMI